MEEKLSKQQEIIEMVEQCILALFECAKKKPADLGLIDEYIAKTDELLSIYDKMNQNSVGVAISKDMIMTKFREIKKCIINENWEILRNMLEMLLMVLDTTKLSITYLNLLIAEQNRNGEVFKKQLFEKYQNSEDAEIQSILQYIKKTGVVNVFNDEFIDKYRNFDVHIEYDESADMYYTMYKGKKMYFKQKDVNEIKNYYTFITLEQDERSPHRYFDDQVFVKEGDIVIDAGVAEGNFALDVIDKVKKIYLIECDKDWAKVLKQTFKDYEDKVVIVEKMLSDFDDDENITIDTLCQNENINFIKMDIEGFEMKALAGAKNTLKTNKDINCTICSYHKSKDEEKIKEFLDNCGYQTYYSNGYMWFNQDEETFVKTELRKAIVKGMKRQ